MGQEVQTEPGGNAEAVTTSNSTVIYSRGIYVGGAGDLVVEMYEGANEVTFYSVPAGAMLPIKVSKVKTATTATNIVRLW